MDSMTKRDAQRAVSHALAVCSDEQARDVADILRLGAGLLGLPEGAALSAPTGLVPQRREAWFSLIEAIRLDRDSEQFRSVRSGDWETVLASLVILGDWATIAQTAEDLRSDADNVHRVAYP